MLLRDLPLTRLAGCLLLLLSLWLAGCAAPYTPGVTVQPALRSLGVDGALATGRSSEPPPPEYRINVGDQLSVRFPRRPAYSDNYVVRTDGHITLPLLGSVAAASLTPDELQVSLTQRYRDLVTALPPAAERQYLVQSGDQLEVRFSFFPDLNSTVTVRPDGRVSLPMVGEVLAEGHTPADLQARLLGLYKGRVPNPELVVSLREMRSNVYFHDRQMRQLPDPGLIDVAINVTKTAPLVVYVGGEVATPGVQPFMSGVNVLQTLYAAGGPATTGDLRSVVILRRGEGDQVIRVVADLTQDLAGTGTGNLTIRPFDVVIVPRSTVAQTGDTLEQYLYRIVRPLANSSIGFYFTRQVGAVDQRTTIQP